MTEVKTEIKHFVAILTKIEIKHFVEIFEPGSGDWDKINEIELQDPEKFVCPDNCDEFFRGVNYVSVFAYRFFDVIKKSVEIDGEFFAKSEKIYTSKKIFPGGKVDILRGTEIKKLGGKIRPKTWKYLKDFLIKKSVVRTRANTWEPFDPETDQIIT